jgi:O-methyltransferase
MNVRGVRGRFLQAVAAADEPGWDSLERDRAAEVGLGDLDPDVLEIIARTEPYTLTSPERIAALCATVDYIVAADVPGAIVECGVWRGGSLMAAALRLLALGGASRDLVAFDTFSGMSAPTSLDVDYTGERWESWTPPGSADDGARLPEVRERLRSTGYPTERLQFVPGDVAETLPRAAPAEIALLRLDTDWYESTRAELVHLYPRLRVGGVLIVDDYGHYLGARKAVDEYFADHRVFLHRIDYTGRIAVKQHH